MWERVPVLKQNALWALPQTLPYAYFNNTLSLHSGKSTEDNNSEDSI